MQAPASLRRPLAIVFCDIVGASRVIAREGDLVASTVFREFLEHAGRLGKEHHCLMIKFIGDAFLATFENIDDVIPLVFSVERLLSQNHTFIGRLEGFKFSLHYGDCLCIDTSYGSDVLGEDVNIAAYLNEIAQPHEIIISQAALQRMPRDFRDRAGASETRQFKRVGEVEFRRVNLLGS